MLSNFDSEAAVGASAEQDKSIVHDGSEVAANDWFGHVGRTPLLDAIQTAP